MLKIDDNIRNSTKLMNSILDTISSAVFVIDKHYNVVEYNSSFLDIFGSTSVNPIHELCGAEAYKSPSNKEHNIGIYLDSESCEVCDNCSIKKAIDCTILDGRCIERQIINRDFIEGDEVKKRYFLFSSKPISISGEVHAVVVIDDITHMEEVKAELIDRNNEISKYNKLFKEEMQLAKKVQRSIIPLKSIRHKGYTLTSRYYPLQAVGGDMYDYFVVDEDKIGILMCDVVGHGIGASLITTMIKAILESSRSLHTKPKDFVTKLNESIIRIADGFYLTLIYGIIDVSTSKFSFVRAGHPFPVSIDKNEGVKEIGSVDNIFVGLEKGYDFKEETYSIRAGEKILIFTDGLMDIGSSYEGYEDEVFSILSEEVNAPVEKIIESLEVNVRKRLLSDIKKDDVCIIMIGRKDDESDIEMGVKSEE